MDINGPIALEENTKLVALGFDRDPLFGSIFSKECLKGT